MNPVPYRNPACTISGSVIFWNPRISSMNVAQTARAVEARLRHRGEPVDDLLPGADQRIAAPAGDEMLLHLVRHARAAVCALRPMVATRLSAASQSPFWWTYSSK